MAEIKLFRIDSRLIHGQIITKWIKVAGVDKIVVVDEILAADEFMKEIYVAAVPKGISVNIYNLEEGMDAWKENEFGQGKVLMLVRDVKTCLELYKRGFPIKSIQIGELPNGSDRVPIYKAVSFTKDEAAELKKLYDNGIEIILHIVPDNPPVEFEKVIKKINL